MKELKRSKIVFLLAPLCPSHLYVSKIMSFRVSYWHAGNPGIKEVPKIIKGDKAGVGSSRVVHTDKQSFKQPSIHISSSEQRTEEDFLHIFSFHPRSNWFIRLSGRGRDVLPIECEVTVFKHVLDWSSSLWSSFTKLTYFPVQPTYLTPDRVLEARRNIRSCIAIHRPCVFGCLGLLWWPDMSDRGAGLRPRLRPDKTR